MLALGLKRGDRLAILMDNRAEWLIAYFAALSIGVEVVALNCWASPPELAYQLTHAKVRVLVATDAVRGRPLPELLGDIAAREEAPVLDRVICVAERGPEKATPFSTLPALGAKIDDQTLIAAGAAVAPTDTASWQGLGDIYRSRETYNAAMEAYQQVIDQAEIPFWDIGLATEIVCVSDKDRAVHFSIFILGNQ